MQRRRSGKAGVAAIEFGLVAPILGLLVVGVFDISKVLILSAQIQNAARLIAISASTVAASAGQTSQTQTTSLTTAQAQQAMSIIYADVPWLRSGVETNAAYVTLSSVNYIAAPGCTVTSGTNCYVATVMWSMAYASLAHPGKPFSSPILRPCAALVQIAPTASIPPLQTAMTTIRTLNVTLPDAILVADVQYTYVPFFVGRFLPTITLSSTGLWSDRSSSAQNGLPPYTTLAPDGTTAWYCQNPISQS